MYTCIALRALKVSYSDIGERGVAMNCEKTKFFLNTLYHFTFIVIIIIIILSPGPAQAGPGGLVMGGRRLSFGEEEDEEDGDVLPAMALLTNQQFIQGIIGK